MVTAVDAAAANFPGEPARGCAGLALLKQGGVTVIEILQFNARNFLADEAFDGENMGGILGHHDGKSIASGGCATGTANPMDVILGVLGHIVIDDVADFRDVEPARGDISRHEHFKFSVAKPLQGLLALALGAIGMKHSDGMISALDRPRVWCGKTR